MQAAAAPRQLQVPGGMDPPGAAAAAGALGRSDPLDSGGGIGAEARAALAARTAAVAGNGGGQAATLVPLAEGCPVMAAARGRGRWFSGVVARVRSGESGGSRGGRRLGEWVYDVRYADGDAETSLCGALLAPCL
jgi:hypothetical protein